MLDSLLLSHLLLQAGRIAAAAFLFFTMYAVGAAVLRFEIADPTERLLLRIATGFAVYQFVIRWLGELPVLTRAGVWIITIALAAIAAFVAKTELRTGRIACPPLALLLLLAPLAMALAPAVSQDALIYHLRFPELTLQHGQWAYDPASSASYYPSATGTLYVAALALDPQGIIAQLVHFGCFVLAMLAAGAIARRLGATTGSWAALLFAAVPCAGIVAGWAWADLSLLFAIGAAVLAAFGGAFTLALALLGLAASIKYTALLACVPIAIVIVIAALRARRAKALLAGIVLALLVVSPWYVTNAIRTGNPVYPLAASQNTESVVTSWSRDDTRSWAGVWRGYFFAPQTLDEDIGGAMFLIIAITGLTIAFTNKRTRVAAAAAAAMWIIFLPLTTPMRLLLPAVAATLVVCGAALEQWTGARHAIAFAVYLFALRGGLIVAAHNAHFFNPLPAAVGIENEKHYVTRNFPPAAIYERVDRLGRDARFVAINEVRLFRFPRPVSASRVVDPPLLARYIEGARSADEIVARFRRDRVTHLLLGTKPVERGPRPKFSPAAETLFNEVIRRSRVVARQGSTIVLELPRNAAVPGG